MQKNEIRSRLMDAKGDRLERSRGQIAEVLRHQTVYRQAKAIFVSPSPLLGQVRMNSLADGKALITPTAGLKDGFMLLRPYSVPFAKLSYAVSPKGMREFGKSVNRAEELDGFSLGLLVGDCEAVDKRGLMIGDGHGFFDLSSAIFNAWRVLAADVQLVAVVAKQNMLSAEVDAESWDCYADMAITEEGLFELQRAEGKSPPPEIIWQALPEKRVRKISPLWKLWNDQLLFSRKTGSSPQSSA